MCCLHLRQLAKEGHCSPQIEEAINLYQPKDRIVITPCNREQVLIPEDLPLSFCEDKELSNIVHCSLPDEIGSFVRNEHLPM